MVEGLAHGEVGSLVFTEDALVLALRPGARKWRDSSLDLISCLKVQTQRGVTACCDAPGRFSVREYETMLQQDHDEDEEEEEEEAGEAAATVPHALDVLNDEQLVLSISQTRISLNGNRATAWRASSSRRFRRRRSSLRREENLWPKAHMLPFLQQQQPRAAPGPAGRCPCPCPPAPASRRGSRTVTTPPWRATPTAATRASAAHGRRRRAR